MSGMPWSSGRTRSALATAAGATLSRSATERGQGAEGVIRGRRRLFPPSVVRPGAERLPVQVHVRLGDGVGPEERICPLPRGEALLAQDAAHEGRVDRPVHDAVLPPQERKLWAIKRWWKYRGSSRGGSTATWMPLGPSSAAIACASVRLPAMAEANAAKPDEPRIEAVAPVRMTVPRPRASIRAATARALRKAEKVAISHTL